MITYALGLILAVGIPFLLYCLWNFSRELRPRKSTAVLSSSSWRHMTLCAYQCPGSETNRTPLSGDTKVVWPPNLDLFSCARSLRDFDVRLFLSRSMMPVLPHGWGREAPGLDVV